MTLSDVRTFKARRATIGRDRCVYLARRFGNELRLARLAVGLTQGQLARLAEVSQSVVSDGERGDPSLSLDVRCRLVAICGHELGWRLYPTATVSLRDSGQLGIANALASAAHERWTIELERPVTAGDLRAADVLLRLPDEMVHIEIERALADAQAQIRAAQVKREILQEHEGRPVRLVIAVPDTRVTRARLATIRAVTERTFPTSSRAIWRSIREGLPVGGDGIVFVRPDRVAR